MATIPQKSYRLAARAIHRQLGRPIKIPLSVRAFAESTLGIATAEEIAACLSANDSDGEQVLDLLLFPNEGDQMELEPLLEALPPDEDCCSWLVGLLLDPRPQLSIQLESGQADSLGLPVEAIERYVARLNPQRVLDPLTLACIEQTLPIRAQLMVKVAIRNHDIAPVPASWKLLRHFIRTMAPDRPVYRSYLLLLLEVLETIPDQGDYYGALKRRKRRFTGELRRWKQFHQYQEKMPMDALLSRGIQPPPMSRQAIAMEIDRIDGLTQTLFGRTAPEVRPQIIRQTRRPVTDPGYEDTGSSGVQSINDNSVVIPAQQLLNSGILGPDEEE